MNSTLTDHSKLDQKLRQLVANLSVEQIKQIEAGDADIALVIKRTPKPKIDVAWDDVNPDEFIKALFASGSRSDAYGMIEDLQPSKEQLVDLLKRIHVGADVKNSIKTLSERLVEGTTGASLRSKAMRSATVASLR